MFEKSKDDSELLWASLRGSSKAFGVLVGRYQSLVCTITYSATGSVEPGPITSSPARPFEFQARGVLSGRVTDIQTGAPVQDAVVRISLARVYRCHTDANGFYSLEDIPEVGTAGVTVESKEHLGASARDQKCVVPLSPDRQAIQHFQIQQVRP